MTTPKKFWIVASISFTVLLILGAVNFSRLSKLYSNSPILKEIYKGFNLIFPDIRTNIRDTFLDMGLHNIAERTGSPLLEIELSRNDIAHFSHLYDQYNLDNDEGEQYMKNNRWRKAKFKFEGNKYKVKIKSQGRLPTSHQIGRYISLAVKLPKGVLIKGANKFSLIIRPRIPLFIVKKLFFARKLGIITQEQEFIRVKINNWPERIYYFEYHLDNNFMESTGRSSLWRLQHPNPTGSHGKSLTYVSPDDYEEKFTLETKNLKDQQVSKAELILRLTDALIRRGVKKESHGPIIERYLTFHEAILNKDSNKLLQLFDQNYITNYAAARLIISLGGHGYLAQNFFNFYNQANGLFYPGITRDDWGYNLLSLAPNQSIERQLFQVPFLALLSKNDSFRQKKYQIIMQIRDKYSLSIEPGLKKIDDVASRHLNFGLFDARARKLVHSLKVGRHGSQFDTYMTDNLDTLTAYLTRVNPHITIWEDANVLTMKIEPHSMSAIGFDHLELDGLKLKEGEIGSAKVSLTRIRGSHITTKFLAAKRFQVSKGGAIDLTGLVKEFEFFDGLDLNSNIVETRYVVKIKFLGIDIGALTKEELNFSMQNRIVGEVISHSSITIEQGEGNAYPDISSSIKVEHESLEESSQFEVMQARFPNIKMSRNRQNELIIHPGVYKITEDLIIPKDLKVVIEAGTTLLVGEGIAILGYQGVDIKGTANAPVIIKALDPSRPYGSFGFLGNEKTRNRIDYLHQSGGSDRWIRGIFFSGGFSVHYSEEVLLRNSKIKDNRSDDGLNFKYVKHVLIEDSIFQDNFADQIDLDFSNAHVINSQLLNTKKADLNGDGIDVSGSSVLISNSKIKGFNDKGISIGERSKVIIHGSKVQSNNIGVAVKDISHAYFVNTDFDSNFKDIAVYRKKRIFGGGFAYIDALVSNAKKIKYEVDSQSKLFILNNQLSKKMQGLNLLEVSLDSIFQKFAEIKNYPVGIQPRKN
jgi:hypothetical protein